MSPVLEQSNAPICVTCGTQFPPSWPRDRCPICDDERQYVAPNGQRWTTIIELRTDHRMSSRWKS